jgi:hypothetical protein
VSADCFDLGESMTTLQLTRDPNGDYSVEIIIYSSKPYDYDSSSYLTISAKRAKELALWLQK